MYKLSIDDLKRAAYYSYSIQILFNVITIYTGPTFDIDRFIDVRYYVRMDSKTTLSITEARKKLFTLAENVQRPSLYYTLTEKGKAKAVLMSVEEFESWQETLEVMRDFPDLKKTIKEVEKDLKAGRYKVYKTLDELEHDLLSQNKTKRRKKST